MYTQKVGFINSFRRVTTLAVAPGEEPDLKKGRCGKYSSIVRKNMRSESRFDSCGRMPLSVARVDDEARLQSENASEKQRSGCHQSKSHFFRRRKLKNGQNKWISLREGCSPPGVFESLKPWNPLTFTNSSSLSSVFPPPHYVFPVDQHFCRSS